MSELNPLPHYTSKFTILSLGEGGKHLFSLLLHANSVGILCLGPDHPLLALPRDWAVTKLCYSDAALQALSTMTGKRKKGAGVLFPHNVLLTATLARTNCYNFDAETKEAEVRIYIPLRLKLVEINKALTRCPWLLTTNHRNQGYLAIGIFRRDYACALTAVLQIHTDRLLSAEESLIKGKERTPTEEQRIAVVRAVGIKVDALELN